MKKEYSREIAEVVNKFLTDDEWHYYFEEEYGIFRFGLNVHGRIKNINFVVDVKEDEFLVYGICPINADNDDADMMARMAEYICRVNYGLKNGCFEFDYKDGEIRYRSYVDCEDLIPSKSVIENTIHCTAAMYRHYSTGIIGIIFEGLSAREALSRCEKDQDAEIHRIAESLGDIDPENMAESLARLAAHLGISLDDDGGAGDEEDTSDETGDGESGSDGSDNIIFDLFSKKEDTDE